MTDNKKDALDRMLRNKALRKIRANRDDAQGIWKNLGMMGLIGWSVAIPTLLGTALGFWLDRRFPGNVSWTLAILFLGLVLGCFNAWHWVKKESDEMEEDANG